MKTLEAGFVLVDEETEEYIEEPYFILYDGRRIKNEDVFGADWKDNDGQIEAAFKAARNGKGELICLNCGDDEVWLTTDDKINSGPFPDDQR